MKFLLAVVVFAFGSMTYAGDPYSFLEAFELKSVEVQGAKATITVEHQETFGQPKFELIAGQACAQTYPAQCYGTVVRLDDSVSMGRLVQSVFEVDLGKLYDVGGVVLTIYGPNSQQFTLKY